jgi:general secretion pathway protein G
MKQHKMKMARGFSLMELLVVMVILGLLASLVGPALFGKVDSSKVKTAQTQIQLLGAALDTYRLDVGDYPDQLIELRRSEARGWDGPYLPKEIPLDPWGNPYAYQKPGENGMPYTLKSLGKDGAPGGQDDSADLSNE